MPSVQHTAALFGLRPVANAFGVKDGATQIEGIGCCARAESSRTIAYSCGCCISVTRYAPMDLSAIVAEFQYEYAVWTSPMPANTTIHTMRPVPEAISAPMASSSAHMLPSRRVVFRPL